MKKQDVFSLFKTEKSSADFAFFTIVAVVSLGKLARSAIFRVITGFSCGACRGLPVGDRKPYRQKNVFL